MIDFLKENKKLCILVICIGFAVLICGTYLFRIMRKQGLSEECPPSSLTDAPRALSDKYLSCKELNMCVRCAGTDYVLWLPADAQMEQDFVKASIGDVNIIVTVSDMEMESMLYNYIPQKLYFSVLGYEPQTSIVMTDSGYFEHYSAQYAVSVSEAQISVRRATCIVLTYAFKVTDLKTVYIAVSSESKENVHVAKSLLDAIASSFRKYEEVEADIQDAMFNDVVQDVKKELEGVSAKDEGDSLAERIGRYDISFKHRVPNSAKDGILVMMWDNYLVEPLTLTVFGVDGGQVMPIEKECVPGFYAFEVGETPAGDYVFKGTTNTELNDVYIELYEADDYYRIYGDK